MQSSFFYALALLALGEYVPELPPTAEAYKSGEYTQSIDRMREFNGFLRPRTLPVRVLDLTNKDWHQSGGTLGIKGVTSEKFRLKDKPPVSRWAPIEVTFKALNGSEERQRERGIVTTHPDGARFDDILWYNGRVFEHRTRVKADGKWTSTVTYRDETAFPPGFKPLKLAECATCHNKAGTGGYSEGLVPGGDTVFSHPLDWSVVPQSARFR